MSVIDFVLGDLSVVQRLGATERWLFVTGPEQAIEDLSIKGFKLGAGQDAGQIVHSSRFILVDRTGKIRGYVGQGRFTDDPLQTFGGAGVVEIPRLQELLHYICENGFEHHVAANLSSTAGAAVYEAAKNYLGWGMYWHQ